MKQMPMAYQPGTLGPGQTSQVQFGQHPIGASPQPVPATPAASPVMAPPLGPQQPFRPSGAELKPDASVEIGGNSGAPGMDVGAMNALKAAGDSLQQHHSGGVDPYSMVFSHGAPAPQQQAPAIAPITAPRINDLVTSDRRAKRSVRSAQSETARFLDELFRGGV